MKTRPSHGLPLARRHRLVIEELPDETLVYDLDRHKAHCLNRTCALVWKRCDGKTTVARIARWLERDVATPLEEDVVFLALGQLREVHLLEEDAQGPVGNVKVSRRDLVGKYLPAALALPLILSITAPATAQGSVDPCTLPDNRPQGCPCLFDSQCASSNCDAGACGPEL